MRQHFVGSAIAPWCKPTSPSRGNASARGNRRNRREQLNEYWRDQRTRVRQARVRSELRLVDPAVFLSNPQLLKQVKSWIDIAGIDYARKTLSETCVAAPHIHHWSSSQSKNEERTERNDNLCVLVVCSHLCD